MSCCTTSTTRKVPAPWRSPTLLAALAVFTFFPTIVSTPLAFVLSPPAFAAPPPPDPDARARLLGKGHLLGHRPAKPGGPGQLASGATGRETEASLRGAQDDYDVRYVELDLDLADLERRFMAGRVRIDLESRADGLGRVILDFAGDFTIDTVLAGGQSATHQWEEGILAIDLPEAADQGERRRLEIFYRGFPASDGFVYDSYNGEAWIWTLSQPELARTWWPCKDRPDDKADSARVRITVPDWMIATSNGVLESREQGSAGTEVFTWFEKYPIAPYLISVTAGRFILLEEIYEDPAGWTLPLHHYVFENLRDAAEEDFSIASAAMRGFSEAFGPYPFQGEKYGCTLFGWAGAMEHQCNTSYGYWLVNGRHSYDWIYVHELGHQWWGDAVTCATWADTWLNEGFASWCEAYWWELQYGKEAYQEYMTVTQRVFDPSGPLYDYPVWFDGNTIYNKGAWAVHMLRGVLGDSLFFSALADYRSLYEGSSVTTAQFQAALEASSGTDLSWFFDSWVYGPDRPHYEFSYRYEAKGAGSGEVDGFSRSSLSEGALSPGALSAGGTLYIHLDQTQATAGHFTMPVTIRVTGPGGGDFVLWNDPDRDDLVLSLSARPESVTLDPDSWILKTVKQVPYTFHLVSTDLEPAPAERTVTRALVAAGGTPPYTWALIDPAPPGIRLDQQAGTLFGRPTQPGDHDFRVRARDSSNPAKLDVQRIFWSIQPAVPDTTEADTTAVIRGIAAHPNPVLRSVLLSRSGAGAGPTEWAVYNLQGREVARNETGPPPAGGARTWVWDGDGSDGRRLPSGVYFVRSRLPLDPAAGAVSGRVVLLN